MKKSEISILAGLVLALIISYMGDINLQAGQIRDNTLRLHIIAQDDSPRSQNIKLQVKDEINRLCADLLCPAENFGQAVQIATENIGYIEQVTNHTLEKLGAEYKSSCSVENFYFDTTEYTDFTLPQGEYTALTIRLGNAEGKNWWCVVYPSLCAGIGAEYEDDDSNTFIETDNFRIKFKTVEIWEDVREFFNGEKVPEYKN